MKRLLISLLIASASLALFLVLHAAAARTQLAFTVQVRAGDSQKQQLLRLETEKQQWVEHITETRQAIAAQPELPTLDALKKKVLAGADWHSFTTAECAQLLAELGFNWNTTGDYLILSKKSLDHINYPGLQGRTLTAAAVGTLALTGDEQSAINTMTAQIMDARLAWDQQHLQRAEPSGNILAQYTLPVDTDLSQGQYTTFTNSILGTLGPQRGQWLLNQSMQWLQDNGIINESDLYLSKIPADLLPELPDQSQTKQPIVMTLSPSGDQILMNLQMEGANMSTTISPWQPVPPAFSPLFPGGWPQIAQLEGFQLPKSFTKH